jgi:aryl-alcohol dehydrogenase-like predicted oxidoreductase
MAYSPLLNGAYIREDRPLTSHYQSYNTNVKLALLKKASNTLGISPNAVVLAWMIQNSPQVVPLVTGSTQAQLDENLQALSVQLTEEQLNNLNQLIVTPDKY